MRDGGEDVAGVGRRSLNAVSVVDASLSSFCIDVEELEVVVKVDGTGAKITSQECCVSGEDGRHIDATLLG